MEIVRCGHGHYYNPELHQECPECARMANKHTDSWFCESAMLQGFRQREKLASGSGGVVYRVEKDGKDYALKVIDCGWNPQKRSYAQTEIALMKKLGRCRNVVPLLDSDLSTSSGTVALLLEPRMTTFEEYYKTHSMTLNDVLQLGIDICTALEDCWSAGVAHLDVQPKNLFVDDSGHFCLGDFSVALSTSDLASEQQLRGTLSYMAPEVYASRNYSQASDIYSLGMVLYCLLNQGNLPFMDRGSKEKAVMTRLEDNVPVPPLHLGSAVDQLLQWMLEVDVRHRCSSFRLLQAALTKAMTQSEQPRKAASSTPPMASKRSPLSWLQKFKKDKQPEDTALYSPPISPLNSAEGTLFDSDSLAQPVPLEVSCEGPCDPISFAPSEFVGCSSPSDFYEPFCASADFQVQPLGGTLFDSDTLARTAPLAASASEACWPTEPICFSPVGDCSPSVFSSAPVGGALFDSDSYASTCAPVPMDCAPPSPCFDSRMPGYYDNARSADSHASAPRMSQVQFSAIAPKEARKEDYSIIQLFMYEQAFRSAVEEAIAMADTPVQEKRSGFQKVRDNTRVKIVLTCPDMPIDDNVQEQVWCGGYLQFDFAICPPETFRKRQILLTAAVYFDDVPATRLMLTIKALASYEEEIEVARQDILTAFVSYASQDRNRVGALVQGMRKARPDMDIFFDVVTLQSGENWENMLYREILRRDILFLCWSRNAMSSEWVDREWRFALENKGLEAIEPIPLEQPDICPPPRELWSKHFNDNLLYIINR